MLDEFTWSRKLLNLHLNDGLVLIIRQSKEQNVL